MATAQTDDIYRLAELELGAGGETVAGLGSLEWALGREPRWDRAGRMLRRAAELGGDTTVLLAYERVARSSGDPAMLLDALERAAGAGTAGMDVVREAVDLAVAAGDPARVEALLLRAVAIGEANTNGMAEAAWALVKLAEGREAADDWRGALDHLSRAIDAAEHEEAQRLTARSVAIAVDKLADPRLAAEAWERLLARDRHDREVWQPLLEIYRRIGDRAVLEAKLREAIECAFDAGWRAELRMERARLLESDRPDDAAAELDEVLQEDEENAAAGALLTRLYERQGRQEDLIELLERRLSSARAHDDAAGVLSLSLRLGELLSRDRPIRPSRSTAPRWTPRPRASSSSGACSRSSRATTTSRIAPTCWSACSSWRAGGRPPIARSPSPICAPGSATRTGRPARWSSASAPIPASPPCASGSPRSTAAASAGPSWPRCSRSRGRASPAPPVSPACARRRRSSSIGSTAPRTPLARSRWRRSAIPATCPSWSTWRAASPARATSRRHRARQRRARPRRGRLRDRVTLLRLRAELSTEADEQDQALADLEAAHRLDPGAWPASSPTPSTAAAPRPRAKPTRRSSSASWTCSSISATSTAPGTRWASGWTAPPATP